MRSNKLYASDMIPDNPLRTNHATSKFSAPSERKLSLGAFLERCRELELNALLLFIIRACNLCMRLARRSVENSGICEIDVGSIECDRVGVFEDVDTIDGWEVLAVRYILSTVDLSCRRTRQ